MKSIIIITILVINASLAFTQITVKRKLIGSTGGSISSSNIDMSLSLGEPLTETISLISGNLFLLQGFQQPYPIHGPVGLDDLFQYIISYKIFPNPSSEHLFVEIYSDMQINLRIRLTNLLGQEMGILEMRFLGVGLQRKSINLLSIPEGTYYLKFMDDNEKLLLTEKIMKF